LKGNKDTFFVESKEKLTARI